jgi:hypothetical protein
MFIRINRDLRGRRHLPAVVAAGVLALAVLSAHGLPSSAEHHMADHGAATGSQVAITICVAVIDSGVAFSIAALLLLGGRALVSTLRRATIAPAPNLVAAAGLGPPGSRAALFQVFLR